MLEWTIEDKFIFQVTVSSSFICKTVYNVFTTQAPCLHSLKALTTDSNNFLRDICHGFPGIFYINNNSISISISYFSCNSPGYSMSPAQDLLFILHCRFIIKIKLLIFPLPGVIQKTFNFWNSLGLCIFKSLDNYF